tara:strand:- start:15516 stop:15911 length:396 start_codon:yes stop_codon:yes gene_type:complete
MDRDESILSMRPEIVQTQTGGSISAEELFQNRTLRPILKGQNDLLLALFDAYVVAHKGVFNRLALDRKGSYIDAAVQKDVAFRNTLKGIVIGQMTSKEFNHYGENSASYNKRISSMIKERFKSQIQLLGQH